MDLARYADLFRAEAQEHLQRLSAALLALESDGGAAALDEAFRAAHTIKGMAATMGYDAAAERAHALENLLAALRAAGEAVGPEAADELLAQADALERALTAALPGAAPADAAAEPATLGQDAEAQTVGAAPAAAPRLRHVRVDPRRLDELSDRLGELAVVRARIEELVREADTPQVRDLVERAGRLVDSLRETALAARMVPAGEVFERFPRMVRDAARTLGRDVEFRVEGSDVEADREVLEAVAEPLVHLLRNAVDHGIEPSAERVAAGKPARGRLTLRAARERAGIRITVEDDGAGVDAERVAAKARRLGALPADAPVPTEPGELLRLLCHPGLSTTDAVTGLSGRGVGMDAVLERVRALGGALELHTAPGAGTCLSMRLPATLALAPALRVRIGAEPYLVPLTHVEEAIELADGVVERQRGREVVRVRGETVPLVRLGRLLEVDGAGDDAAAALVAEVGGRRRALAVDELIAREQIVIKSFDAPRGMLPHVSGVTLLADGRPALVLDPTTVF